MILNEFIKKKYWNKYFDLKEAVKEFNKNKKNKQRYFILKNKKSTSYEVMVLKSQIIW